MLCIMYSDFWISRAWTTIDAFGFGYEIWLTWWCEKDKEIKRGEVKQREDPVKKWAAISDANKVNANKT